MEWPWKNQGLLSWNTSLILPEFKSYQIGTNTLRYFLIFLFKSNSLFCNIIHLTDLVSWLTCYLSHDWLLGWNRTHFVMVTATINNFAAPFGARATRKYISSYLGWKYFIPVSWLSFKTMHPLATASAPRSLGQPCIKWSHTHTLHYSNKYYCNSRSRINVIDVQVGHQK